MVHRRPRAAELDLRRKWTEHLAVRFGMEVFGRAAVTCHHMWLAIHVALAAILGLIIPIVDSLDNLWHHHEGFYSSARL